MLSIRFNRLAIVVTAATSLVLSGPLAAQTPEHPTDTAPFPSAHDLRTMTKSGSYLAARHASVERDAKSAAAFYRSALRTDPKNGELLDRAFISSLAEGDIESAVKLADRILSVDKTNRVAPSSLAEIPQAYVLQLALYRALLRPLYSGRRIAAALLFTEAARLVELPETVMDEALARLTDA